ncbi:MAG: ABC transporter permease [Caldiserica bacterium]|nr:MAG: ABC transporter permease [Caldisericota bacterium]
MDFKFSLFLSSLPYLLKGAKVTITLSLVSVGIGLLIGLGAALLKISKNLIFRTLGSTYVEVIRGTPLLLQIMITYYGLPAVGIKLDAITAGIVALSVNSGAYCAEIFRAGIESIEKGQMEAARSLGMTYAQAMRYVILPQAIKRVVPPLTNEFVAMLKDSSLVSTIAVAELLRRGRQLMGTLANVWSPLIGVGLIYLVMTIPLTQLAQRMERRLRRSEAH